MPAASALSIGARNAVLSTTATASPSAFAEMAALVALTISGTIESFDPVHWNEQPSRAQASCAPYCVGVKNELVVTWLTKTNFHFGVFGKSPTPLPPTVPVVLLFDEHAVRRAAAAAEALTMPAPP